MASETRTVILAAIVASFIAVPISAAAIGSGMSVGHPPGVKPAISGQGTYEIIADSKRPFIYRVFPDSDSLFFLNASTGEPIWNLTTVVGPSPTSIDFSADGNSLYVAISGGNRTVVVDIDSRTVIRTIPLAFSPLSVRHGRPDRLYISEKGRSVMYVVNETTGNTITSISLPATTIEHLLDVSPNGTELLAHSRSSPVWLLRYAIDTDNPILLGSDSNSMGDPEQLLVDWSARTIYFSSMVPYGIELISVDTFSRVKDLWTDAYPTGIALLRERHLAFELSSNPYGSGLWAFNLTNQSLARRVPIGADASTVVVSPVTMMVLIWSPYGVRTFSLAPTLSPAYPPAGGVANQYPYYVSASLWTGIPIVAIDRAEVVVNGQTLRTTVSADLLQGLSSPPVPVGMWSITARIEWNAGSTGVTWTSTVAPPSPIAILDQHPLDPLYVGQTIHFDASSSRVQNYQGQITAYEWDFGDGTSKTGPTADVVYQKAGTFYVTLTVRTDIGDSNQSFARLVVQPFPPITLASYTHSTGFRTLGPSAWNLSENVPVGSSAVEYVFRGPTYRTSPTTLMIDARHDPQANESADALAGKVDLVVNELRNRGGILQVTEPATPRTISGHEGRIFGAVDTYHGIAYEVALVVSAADGQWWIILLTVDLDYLSLYGPMFNAVVDGFVTPTAPLPLGSMVALAAITVGGAGGAIGGLLWWRVRRKKRGSTQPRDSSREPPS